MSEVHTMREIEALRADLDSHMKMANEYMRENMRLRAALADILDGFGLSPPDYVGAEIDEDDLWIVNAARAALEEKHE